MNIPITDKLHAAMRCTNTLKTLTHMTHIHCHLQTYKHYVTYVPTYHFNTIHSYIELQTYIHTYIHTNKRTFMYYIHGVCYDETHITLHAYIACIAYKHTLHTYKRYI